MRGGGSAMLHERETSPDSLSSAALPGGAAGAREHIRHAR